MMFGDDWAYGLTVRHLLQTGEYRLHDWAAANMPTQIYWGALLAEAFGYSFTILRFSTLFLLLGGLTALYYLLRDFGTGDWEASLLSLTVFSSPVVLFQSFTFQTDVQFLAWIILALWLYSRGLRKQNYVIMALASIAAFAAVGTRQFGAALVLGLCGTWLLCQQQRFRKAPLYLTGIAMPLLMTLWQISYGVNRSTFSQKVRLIEQSEFVRDSTDFLLQLVWRPTAILQYLALFLLPLAPVLLTIVRNVRRSQDLGAQRVANANRQRQRRLWLLIAMAAYVTAGLCYEYFIYLPKWLIPYLGWLLLNTGFFPYSFKMRLVLTLVTYGFAVVLGWLIVQRYVARRSWRVMTPEESFVVLTGMATLGLQLLCCSMCSFGMYI
jgi:4-amino-4-deoxy-L-arabinose transferase-like glycosyltransferase